MEGGREVEMVGGKGAGGRGRGGARVGEECIGGRGVVLTEVRKNLNIERKCEDGNLYCWCGSAEQVGSSFKSSLLAKLSARLSSLFVTEQQTSHLAIESNLKPPFM